MAKQITLDGWLISHFAVLLKKASSHVTKTKTPLVLYRNTLEEEDEAYQETVCTITDGYVVVQVITSGGGVVPSFQQQFVFTLDEFPNWLMRKSKDLFMQCLEPLEAQFR